MKGAQIFVITAVFLALSLPIGFAEKITSGKTSAIPLRGAIEVSESEEEQSNPENLAKEIEKGFNASIVAPNVTSQSNETGKQIPSPPIPKKIVTHETRVVRCIEKLRNLRLPSESEARRVCEFIVGVKTRALNEHQRLMRCIAEKHLLNPNATYREIKAVCLKEILKPVEERCPAVEPEMCPKNTVVQPVVDSRGCVVKYECKKIGELKRRAKRITKMLSDRLLIMHLQCMDLPDDVRGEVENLVQELKELVAEHKEKVEEKSEECSSRVTSVENETEIGSIKEECAMELREINREFAEKMKEVRERALEIYEQYRSTLNASCIREMLSARSVIEEYEEKKQEILNNTNLSVEEKQRLLKDLVRNKTRELRKRGMMRKVMIEGVRAFMEKEEAKPVVISALKREGLIREIIQDPEIREEIIAHIVSNPQDAELIKEAIHERKAKIRLIRESRKRLGLKKQLMKKEILREILPQKLRERMDRINVSDIDVEEIGNQTAIRAEVKERAKLLFFIPVAVPKTVKFVGDEIIEERKPWWSFLVTG